MNHVLPNDGKTRVKELNNIHITQRVYGFLIKGSSKMVRTSKIWLFGLRWDSRFRHLPIKFADDGIISIDYYLNYDESQNR